MLELKKFQSDAATSIANRYAFFANHKSRPKKGEIPRPFFQALSALTGAGKTPILAQAVALIRSHFSTEPIVFWMSKSKSVVGQTYNNFSSGGKYSELVDGFTVINVSQLTPALISDGSSALLVMATTGLFNNKDQSDGALNIYKRDEDKFGDKSPWERLIGRLDGDKRRPLIVVYDEGHNLSSQQTELLSELEPDAYLLASATMKLPDSFSKSVIHHIKLWVDESTNDSKIFGDLFALNESGKPDAQKFITSVVSSEAVVDGQLVKKAIQFDGTTAPMERCLDELTDRLKSIQAEVDLRGLGFKPKAIYVCKTNIADDGEKDDSSKPFEHRRAPPIRIWRYLVNEKGVDPKTIAIYANLTFIEGNKPSEVNLFSKGDNDFDDFTAGNFQHIIFNLSLQEGWDDPACYLAYIDKSMGSSIQVEQIIGRALRQYGATHYDTPLLNSAHFFLRVDNQSVFTEALDAVTSKLKAEGAPIEIVGNFGAPGTTTTELQPKLTVSLATVSVDAESACESIAKLVDNFPTYAEGSTDTIGQAHIASKVVDLKALAGTKTDPVWTAEGNTNPVRLRWLITTATRSRSTRAQAITNFKDSKFDVRVQVQSKANIQADALAREIATTFFQQAELAYESLTSFVFGALRVPASAIPFTNGLYERYSGFNKFELPCANELDKLGLTWHRNPSSGGFHIPLLSEGISASFYPDFIIWKDDIVYCVDTKGSHLLTDAVARKLFDIHEDGVVKMRIRFISEGRQTKLVEKPAPGGYTVWKMKNGTPTPVYFDSLKKAVAESLK